MPDFACRYVNFFQRMRDGKCLSKLRAPHGALLLLVCNSVRIEVKTEQDRR